MKKSLLVLLPFLLVSCAPKAFQKGQYENVNQENNMNDRWSETDMQKVVKSLVESMVQHRSVSAAPKPPVVLVTRLQNKTSEHIDTQSIMDMVKIELINSGKVQFVDKEARGDIADEYEYQKDNASAETAKEKGNQTGADLILNGRLDSIVQQIGSDKSVYYKVTLNLTNLKSGLIVWGGQKQLRKRFEKQSVGW
ncbi:MAG: penicillin-binding protein activator LpoB [Bdellovibrionaceae bacterium]|nr:penicillin-binding protein activator LpoB [Pseudobdellovibrionaceae bacterium]|tara:strand:+ start:86634 stop:87218 length:585 start_codon:yes stop_codon:yes gene_type:complete